MREERQQSAEASTRIKRNEIPWNELPTLRIDEVAEVIGISRRQVQKLIEEGDLSVRRVGRIPLVLTSSVTRWATGEEPEANTVVAPIRPEVRRTAQRLLAKVG